MLKIFKRMPRQKFVVYGLVALVLVLVFSPVIINGAAAMGGALKALAYRPQTRTYYIAAEKVDWDYAPQKKDPMTGVGIPSPWGRQTVYQKTRFVQYTDSTFTKKVPQPDYQGILGPTIRGVVGDTIKVVFYNGGSRPYSIHPHGLMYDKNNEGATNAMSGETMNGEGAEDMSTMDMPGMSMPTPSPTYSAPDPTLADGAGAKVDPGSGFTYIWRVRPEAGPSKGQGSSRVWLYHSHVSAHDIYDGLVGPIVITSAAHAGPGGRPDDVDEEFPALFMIFDESKPGMTAAEVEAAQMHTINGRFFDNLEGYVMKKNDRVRWYVMGLGNEADVHTPHWHGNDVVENGVTTDVLEVLPASMLTVDMKPDAVGVWSFHCHVTDHMEAGMMAYYTVKKQ
jgi:FtsP/CotA-like multicopper oxidase with cupredoxin domain